MAVSTSKNGPTLSDVHQWLLHLGSLHGVLTSLVMEPHVKEAGTWKLRLIAKRVPAGPNEALRSATGIPNVCIWEVYWNPEHNKDMPSTLFRGCFELEIMTMEMLEQLTLPT